MLYTFLILNSALRYQSLVWNPGSVAFVCVDEPASDVGQPRKGLARLVRAASPIGEATGVRFLTAFLRLS